MYCRPIKFSFLVAASLLVGSILISGTQAMSQQQTSPIDTAAIEKATLAKGTLDPKHANTGERFRTERTCAPCLA